MFPFLFVCVFFVVVVFFSVSHSVSVYSKFKDINLVVPVTILASTICTFFQFLVFHIGCS